MNLENTTPLAEIRNLVGGRGLAALVGDLQHIGTAWAHHGLRIGVAALQTTASTLHLAAETLGRVTETLEAHGAQAEAPAESDPPAR